MVILLSGPKNSGKTYLIEKSKSDMYKFPFVPYQKEFLAKDKNDTGKGSKETWHFTTGYDITILSLNKANLIRSIFPVLVDRSFLDNIVLGVMQERITENYGYEYIDYLHAQGYLENVRILYVDKKNKEQGRTIKKDDWEFLEYEKQVELFAKYIKHLSKKYNIKTYQFVNKFDTESVESFKSMIHQIEKEKLSRSLKKILGGLVDSVFDTPDQD